MLHNRRQIKIGLTGGIGTGKTFVAEVFSKLGISVFNSDSHAKKCMQEIGQLRNQICKSFGSDIYQEERLQKQKLANIVFSDSQKLQELNLNTRSFYQMQQVESFLLDHKFQRYHFHKEANLDRQRLEGVKKRFPLID